MATMLHKIFGNGSLPEEIRGELKTVLLQMRNERNQFQDVAKGIAASVQQAQALATPVDEAKASLADVEVRCQAVTELAPQFDGLQQRADTLRQQADALSQQVDALSTAQQETQSRVAEAERVAAGVRGDLAELRDLARTATGLKAELAELVELGNKMPAMRDDATRIGNLLESLGRETAQLAERQRELGERESATTVSVASLEARYHQMETGFQVVDTRAQQLELVIERLEELASGVPNVRRELGTLKALGDYVAQRTSELEAQRDVIDRAADQTEHLGELVRKVDREIETQRENARFLVTIQENIDALSARHEELEESTESIRDRQGAIAEDNARRLAELADLRNAFSTEVGEATSRMAFEREGLDAVSARVTDLREVVADVERRVHALDETRESASAAQDRLDELLVRAEALAADLDRLTERTACVPAARAEVDEMLRSVTELAERLAALQPGDENSLEALERRLADLDTGFESIEGRAERLEDFTRHLRALATEVDQRQATVEATLDRLHGATALREEAEGIVATLRKQIDVVTVGASAAEARADSIGEVCEVLERRADALEGVRERMRVFETRLARWEQTESAVARALDAVEQRRASVDALKADLQRLFEIAEHTTESVRAIAGARHELDDGRTALAEMVEQVRAIRSEYGRLEDRQHGLADAEGLVARAEALMIDIGGSVQTLQGQQAFLTQAVEAAGALRFQVKQAEVLIGALRQQGDLVSARANAE